MNKVVSLRVHQPVHVREINKTVDKFGLGGDDKVIKCPIAQVDQGFTVTVGKGVYFIPNANVRYAQIVEANELTGEDEGLSDEQPADAPVKKPKSRKKNANDSE